MAADMAVKAKAPPPVVVAWTGCYVGANGGGMWGYDRFSFRQGGDFLNPVNLFANPTNNALTAHSYRPDNATGTGGVQVGCNWQASSWVFGLEADINGAGSLNSTTNFGPIGPFVGGGGGLMAPHTEDVSKQLTWYSTIRGRIGFTPTANLLLYATGGAAIADVKSSATLTFAPGQFFLSDTQYVGSARETRFGYAVGAGAEWKFAPNWSVKGEYLFLDLGDINYNARCVSGVGCGPGTNFLWTTNVKVQEHVGRVGVNYHFGGPVVAKY
ncbi:outer membrane beta-barrel protein [Bradyrhizobium sp.]|uniref:outer membrane protein n=1 Tax=Bradyrhizobium sp. TaxID=376 RepID=UPI001D746871|nr:outer membrane beta-barrel protein [Bradyrhizobium sp.]MBI5323475.1 porin family protein [Bradyrhizobium sp.]